ncbi:hypothetical protein BDV30DRAFT_217929 [Aspergillus minisclerotigenes]|uniref:Uncharacterized protein n=1 Tax=Aspergillus minisclerotigenes TaxID=656917 RepID=A0A5N6IRD0_9EURO|nr:hypothetical protein BDV30DRAFT_217929 [Aspergillus minisclerotigenes]
MRSTQKVQQKTCVSCMYVQCTTGTTACAQPDYSAQEVLFFRFLFPLSDDWYQLSRRKERWGSRRRIHLYPLGTTPAPKFPKLSVALRLRWGSSIGNT